MMCYSDAIQHITNTITSKIEITHKTKIKTIEYNQSTIYSYDILFVMLSYPPPPPLPFFLRFLLDTTSIYPPI